MKTWLEVKSIGVLNYHKSNISMPWEWINIVKYMTERSKQRQVWKMLLYFHEKSNEDIKLLEKEKKLY